MHPTPARKESPKLRAFVLLLCVVCSWILVTNVGCSTTGAAAKQSSSKGITRQPRLVSAPKPVYPAELKSEGIAGKAVVEFVVDSSGNVSKAKVIQATHPAFGRAAVECVMKFKFTQPMKDGRPIGARLRQELFFRIEE